MGIFLGGKGGGGGMSVLVRQNRRIVYPLFFWTIRLFCWAIAKRAGVFWGGIRYSLHVFSGDNITHHRTSHEIQHGNHRVDHEKYCEAIYWKYHTSHLITKISHTITSKTFFFIKIPFLLGTSKIPYQNQVKYISWYFITPLTEIHVVCTGSHPKIPPEKRKHIKTTIRRQIKTNNTRPSHHFYFYNFHNPSHTPSQKLILITNINLIKIISINL